MTTHQIIVKDKLGNRIGEFSKWFNLKFSDQINSYGEAIFDIQIDDEEATSLVSLRRYEIDILENGEVVWSGEQVNASVTLAANSANLVTITCYTYVEMLNAFYTPEYVRYDQIDQAEILKALVVAFQSQPGGNLGFTFAPITPTKPRDREYKIDNIMEAFINMSNVIEGVDFWIDKDKVIHFGAPKRGSDKTNQFAFEWGVNIEEMTVTDNFSSPATKGYAIGSSDGVNLLIESFSDATALGTYGLREQTTSSIDVSESETLLDKAEDLVEKNKSQRRSLRITQLPNTTPSLRQVSIGDTIQGRLKKGRYDINSGFRVAGYECIVGQVGESSITWIVTDY